MGDSLLPEHLTQERRRRRPGCVLIGVIVLLVLAGAFVGYRLIMAGRVRAALQAIRDAGYPATLEELDAWYEWPEGENAADLYQQAFASYVEPNDELQELLPLVGTAELPPPGEPLPEEMKAAISQHLTANKEILELLHEAATIEGCRYAIDLTQAPLVLHLGPMETCARLLALEALLEADEGQTELAARSVGSSLALACSLAEQPTLISLLVRIALDGMAIDDLEWALSKAPLTDAGLAALARAVERAENPEGLTRALVGERCLGSSMIQMFPSAPGGPADTSPLCTLLVKASGLWDMEHTAYLRMMGESIAQSGKPFPDRFAAFQPEATGDREDELPGRHFVASMLALVIDGAAEEDANHTGLMRAARAGLAVERYRLARGELPARLDDLVPEYLDAVPTDPIDGKQLRYKKLDKGYVVYSIGPDGTDDGGKRKEDSKTGWDVPFTVAR